MTAMSRSSPATSPRATPAARCSTPISKAIDHNSAALYVRRDGGYIAMYAAHAADTLTRWRVANPASSARSGVRTRHSIMALR